MADVRIYTGSDHAGFSLRNTLVARLRTQGREVVDLGTNSDAACDYPEFASAVGNAVRRDPRALGILVCATGQGMAIAAGKVRGIRAVVPATVEAARLSRFDNNANVLCIGGRLLAELDAFAIVDTWLSTSFAGGRHARRIAKVAAIETASAVAFITESERYNLAAMGVPARIFDRDPLLISAQGHAHKAVPNALGWVSLPADMTAKLPEITSFIEEVRKARFTDLIVLVEGAERSPIIPLLQLWGSGGLALHILTSGKRLALTDLEASVQLRTALVLAFAESGSSQAVAKMESLLWTKMLDLYAGDAKRAGGHFAAIAPAQSPLAEIAQAHNYRRAFVDAGEVGDSFRVLGFEGLVPAALFGIDPGRLLARAMAMVESCRGARLEDNPGVNLGILLGAMAKHGRFKLTLLVSKSLLAMGPWIAELLSVATSGSERHIITLWGEPLQPSYPPDRLFVHLQAESDAPAVPLAQMEALHTAGQPYIQIAVHDKYELAGEIYRWEIAATVAALVLGVKASSPVAKPKAAEEGSLPASPT